MLSRRPAAAVTTTLTAIACLALVGVSNAEDAPAPAPAPAAPPNAALPGGPPSPWVWKGRLGGFMGNVASKNADNSHDPTINGTTSSTSWLTSLEAGLGWKSDRDSVDNALKARYGRIRVQGGGWDENNDEIRYDGVYRREVYKPTFIYLGWGAESVFTGPPPYSSAFDPTLGKVSAGVGQRYEDFQLDHNKLEWRLGARAQKYWGKSVTPGQHGVQTGAEAYLRYDHELIDQTDPEKKKPTMRFFAQYEGFSEFNDLGHITNLITAGLSFQISRYLAAEFGVRAYYETRQKEDDGTATGYNEWSIRQDTLVGLTYLW